MKKNYPNNTYDTDGFTILEILIAMSIFAIGILGVAKMQLTAVNDNTGTRKYTEASAWGISQIERIMATSYDDASLEDGESGSDTDPQEIYTINWSVTESDPVPDVKKIEILVSWGNQKFEAVYYKAKDY
ncbi:MAG: prepilin-type N-terminal cleavage/methylation domain-containing protein [Desulfobacteraceae bacterium]|nr:prepilin-type N-terminal cleavage/methylation domain-containing protein [Desulfobacteraceae bacterium]